MRKNFEQPNAEDRPGSENIVNEQFLPQEVKSEKAPLTERIDVALGRQDEFLNQQESKHNRKTLSGFKKFVATAMLMSSSFLAIGCNAEKQDAPRPEGQKVESHDGFLDNAHENASRRAKIIKDGWDFHNKMKKYKATPEEERTAHETIKQMKHPMIDQGEQSGGVQRPGKEVKQGPSGRVMNPEDL